MRFPVSSQVHDPPLLHYFTVRYLTLLHTALQCPRSGGLMPKTIKLNRLDTGAPSWATRGCRELLLTLTAAPWASALAPNLHTLGRGMALFYMSCAPTHLLLQGRTLSSPAAAIASLLPHLLQALRRGWRTLLSWRSSSGGTLPPLPRSSCCVRICRCASTDATAGEAGLLAAPGQRHGRGQGVEEGRFCQGRGVQVWASQYPEGMLRRGQPVGGEPHPGVHTQGSTLVVDAEVPGMPDQPLQIPEVTPPTLRLGSPHLPPPPLPWRCRCWAAASSSSCCAGG